MGRREVGSAPLDGKMVGGGATERASEAAIPSERKRAYNSCG